ncbi:unnamed protein product, partial [Lampetra planeri]
VSPPPCLRVSLDHLDELLQLRLTNLTAQSRWQPRYQVEEVVVEEEEVEEVEEVVEVEEVEEVVVVVEEVVVVVAVEMVKYTRQ